MNHTSNNKPDDTMNSNSPRLCTRPTVDPANPRAIPRGRRRTPGPAHRALAWLAGGLLLFGAGSAPAAAEGPPGTDPARLLLPAAAAATASARPEPPWRGPNPLRLMRLNPRLPEAAEDWLQPGRELRLDLLEDLELTLRIEEVQRTVEGGYVVHGHAASDPSSTVTLTLQRTELTGMVSLDGPGHFQIAPAGEDGLHEVRELNSRPPGFCGTRHSPRPGETPAAPGRAGVGLHAGSPPPADTQPEPTVVDVLFLYTPQAVIGEGSEEGLRRRVLEAVEGVNFFLTNSRVNVHIQPVFIGLINYPETGDMRLDLTRLANGIEGLERARALRNDYKADLVCLITELENQGIGGIAWDITPPGGNPATGFTVVRRVHLAREDALLAHELGHLFGCAHDREQAGDLEDPWYKARRPNIFGHRFEVEGVTYVEIMGYEPGIRVPYFSNPRLDLDGVPLGVPAEQPRPSDGARTINEIAPYVARYRIARSRIEFTSPRVFGQERPGQESRVVVGLRRTGDLDTSTRVNVVFDAASPAKAGLDYVWPDSTWVSFETNQAAAELSFEILADDLVEGEETLRLRLTGPQDDHGLGAQSVCEVSIRDADVPLEFAQLEFPDGPLTVQETAGEARVRVRYPYPYPPPDLQPPLAVPYRTADGTAVAGQDYQAVAGTLVLAHADAATEWNLSIPLLPRPEPGPDRSFTLIVGTRTNTVRIVDAQRPGALVGTPGENLDPDGFGVLNALARGDGRLLVWGNFSRLSAEARHGLALLTRDGAVDPAFRPPELWLGHRQFEELGRYWPNAGVFRVKLQPDGKLVLAGAFSRVNGQPRYSLLRLHPDGSVDESFGRELRFDGLVRDLVIQPDGRIVVGGAFEHINGRRRPFIARLLPDGTPDDSFQPNGGPTSGWTVIILALDLQPDGRILMGGYFEKVDGQPMLNLARLNPDGTFDRTFKLRHGASGPVGRIWQQPDGRIVVSGYFDTIGGRGSRRLARLLADGTPDPGFRPPQPNAEVFNIAMLPDGRLLVNGLFTTIAGQNRRFWPCCRPTERWTRRWTSARARLAFHGSRGLGEHPSSRMARCIWSGHSRSSTACRPPMWPGCAWASWRRAWPRRAWLRDR